VKKLLLILAGQFFMCVSYCQAIRKYPIGNSGCSAYFYCNPGDFNLSYSEDSSQVYTAECKKDSTGYGVICVKLAQTVLDIAEAENLLVQYLDFLKTSLNITSSAGYGKGHRLRGNENIHGIVDYWKDIDNGKWKVKGWTDGKYIVVLYANSRKELSEEKSDIFLDGILMK
jgi:hypothetical protein